MEQLETLKTTLETSETEITEIPIGLVVKNNFTKKTHKVLGVMREVDYATNRLETLLILSGFQGVWPIDTFIESFAPLTPLSSHPVHIMPLS